MEAILEKVKRFLTKWNELITIPLAFILWGFSGPLLRFFDPTSGVYDAGVFQEILFVIIVALILCGFVRIVMKLQWPGLDIYLDTQFNKDFKKLTPIQKICISASGYFLFFLSLVLLFLAL